MDCIGLLVQDGCYRQLPNSEKDSNRGKVTQSLGPQLLGLVIHSASLARADRGLQSPWSNLLANFLVQAVFNSCYEESIHHVKKSPNQLFGLR